MSDLLYNANGVIALITILIVVSVLFFTKIKHSQLWRVTVTPLAAIIGSGFLIAAPLLFSNFGLYSIPFVLGLNVLAFGLGSGVRTIISNQEEVESNALFRKLEKFSNIVLLVCYFIATAFYVSLLSEFLFELIKVDSHIGAKVLSTSILVFLGIFGYFKGLHQLENMEKFAVNIKMAVIAGLIVTVAVYAIASLNGSTETTYIYDALDLNIDKIRILGGLLLITQGFETVKFLDDYDVKLKNKAMILAQVLAALIYLSFVPLVGPITNSVEGEITETAIIEIVSIVAMGMGIILPLAAVFSQFGAATADVIAGGSLIEEAVNHKLTEKTAYIPLIIIAIILLWAFPVMQIISLASRFFALYYGTQNIIAAGINAKQKKYHYTALYIALSTVALVIFMFAVT